MIGIPCEARRAEAVDLPVAMPPVRPTTADVMEGKGKGVVEDVLLVQRNEGASTEHGCFEVAFIIPSAQPRDKSTPNE